MDKGIYKKDEMTVRVLGECGSKILVIDCIKLSMPKWINTLDGFVRVPEDDLGVCFEDMENISPKAKRTMYERYTLISGVLSFVSDEYMRTKAIESISKEQNVSKQTIRKYLCMYLVYQDIRSLAPTEKSSKRELTKDEKNIRWALNKFFYNKNQNSVKYAYTMMLKEKYTDKEGVLKEVYPSFYQFRYFYRKNKRIETYLISRNGIKDYQKNRRPLLGDGIQEFAPNIGTAMLDSTICDIYLVNEKGEVIGRPILTAAIDGYSGICCGYSLSWEGGIYSLRNLMLNVITDKKEHCKRFGINIDRDDWNCNLMPLKLVTDKGSEYKGENFEQLVDLGINIVNLPAYRPELKGNVEKFFDVIQNYFKPYLKGMGVIEPDFQERGAHDYRRDATLTIEQFEEVIIRCILFYNCKRIIEDFPYTGDMLEKGIKPHSSEIWNYGLENGANLIKVDKRELVLTLLPRTTGKFTRQGLKVNGLRYHNEYFREEYLLGKEVTVSYNPDLVNVVYLIENGKYIEFTLIESRFKDKDLGEVSKMKEAGKRLVKDERESKLQAEIDLSKHIQIIRENASRGERSTKNIRSNRKAEQRKTHKNLIEEVGIYE